MMAAVRMPALRPASQSVGVSPSIQAASAAIELRVNGAVRQASTTAKLIWNIAETIEHLSAAWVLQPGDLIYTGTPAGVGAVTRGQVMEGRIEGLGELRVRVR